MTNKQIIEYYNSHLNITLAELSAISGRTVKAIKKILLNDAGWVKP